MRVISVRNVHQALPHGIRLLEEDGIICDSRAGRVLQAPCPVTTVYARPWERCVFWPQRDYNVAFVLYEALWMLAGRNDTTPLDRYIRDYTERFSDDGRTQHGAYGRRWRRHFGLDQLRYAEAMLRNVRNDRRCVLQMWDSCTDLGRPSKDVPCNVAATLQVDTEGALNLCVFCRSNDIVWGAYYANAFHFSLMQEYLAAAIGCGVGTYTQVSVNFHAYKDVFDKVRGLPHGDGYLLGPEKHPACPYTDGTVRPTRLSPVSKLNDRAISQLLDLADDRTQWRLAAPSSDADLFYAAAARVLRAHHLWRTLDAPRRYAEPLALLDLHNDASDLVVAMRHWLKRRQLTWEQRQEAAR